MLEGFIELMLAINFYYRLTKRCFWVARNDLGGCLYPGNGFFYRISQLWFRFLRIQRQCSFHMLRHGFKSPGMHARGFNFILFDFVCDFGNISVN